MTENEKPIGPDDAIQNEDGEADTEGHNMGYELARQTARDKVRETDNWAHKEALRRQVKKSPFDRLRGR
ncbi:MAG: hypothetical protein ACRDF7_02175 [Candidatus Limnocylindrales bacterium]